ncbi:MAG TPA: family 16 glycosylhydrolase [Candidatus Sulfotelmatobacter sp.]|nr:family 16 glycosylhydrolase [Candidatus Sulfotelmatobacter sp.]
MAGFSTAGLLQTFSDGFTSLALNNGATGTWTTHYPFNGGTANDRTLAVNDEAEIYVDPSFAGTGATPLGLNPFAISTNGLSITAAPTQAALLPVLDDLPYTSGMITSDGTFAQQYGYFDMRAELPAGQGLWPGFWMLPAAQGVPGEIDVMEMLGQSPSTIYESTHGSNATQEFRASYTGPNFSAGFHDFGLDWTASTITWYLDGVAIASEPTPSEDKQPMYIIADLAVGGAGSWPGAPNGSTPFPATMQIESIQAYADPNHVVALPNLPSSGAPVAWIHAGAAGEIVTATNVNTQLGTSYLNTTLVGGSGSDIFCVADPSDVVQAQATGINTVESWAHRYVLPDHVENLVLEQSAGTTGIGNALDDHLTGNVGNDTLVAGDGTDLLTGGGGSDLFVLDHAGTAAITDFATGLGGDTIKLDAPEFESFNDVRAAMAQIGPDVVLTTGTHGTLTFENAALGSFTPNNVELPLSLPASPAPVNYVAATATGQILTANEPDSQISSHWGGVTMVGSQGGNTYMIADPTDIVEQAAVGTNTVDSWAHSYTLPANVQNLVIEATGGATAIGNTQNDMLTGNVGNDSLVGGSANNVLIGGGGSDTFTGGGGSNLYVFGPADHDALITNFAVGRDHLDLRAVIAALSPSTSPIEADHVSLQAAGNGTAVMITPGGAAPAHTLVELQGVAPGALHPEVDFFL